METLSFFEEAKIVFKKNNYLESIKLFEKAIVNDGLSLSDQIFSYEKIKQIHTVLKKETPLVVSQRLSHLYKQTEQMDKAEKFFHELYQKTGAAFYLREAYACANANGDLRIAKEYSKLYIQQLIKDKRPNDILSFIEEYERFLEESELSLWRVSALLLKGSREGVLEELAKVTDEDHKKNFIIQEIVKYAEKKTHFWQSDKRLLNILINHLSISDSQIVISKKQVAKLIMNYWMENTIEHDLIEATIKICKRYQLNFIGAEISNYLEDYKLARVFESRIPQELLIQDVDLGSDLFSAEAEETEEDRIVRNIELLRSLNKREELEKELSLLKKVNPAHPLVSDSDDLSDLSSEEIYKNLMKEVSLYSSMKTEEPNEQDYKYMANHYDYEYIQDNYEDMIVGLNLLNLPSVAYEIAEKVETSILAEDQKINLEYLKLEILMTLGDYYKVRDVVDDMLSNHPVVGDELLALLYLRAEAYLNLEDYKKAYYSFKEIVALNKTYRLARQRLKELEKYK